MTAVEIQTKIAETEAALETAKRRKKATKHLREELEALVAEAERITAEAAQVKRPVGRPRKYIAEYYEFIEQYKRPGRGRPDRAQVIADLDSLGAGYDPSVPTRTLEIIRKGVYNYKLAKLRVEVK